MTKKLTDEGIKEEDLSGFDEVEEIDLPPRKPKLLPQAIIERPPTEMEKRQAIKSFNENPTTKMYGAKAMKKSTYVALWMAFGLVFLLLLANTFWFNINFNKKDFSPIVNNDHTINVEQPNITTPIYSNVTSNTENQFEMNFYLEGNLTKQIADEVLDIIKNNTNSS